MGKNTTLRICVMLPLLLLSLAGNATELPPEPLDKGKAMPPDPLDKNRAMPVDPYDKEKSKNKSKSKAMPIDPLGKDKARMPIDPYNKGKAVPRGAVDKVR